MMITKTPLNELNNRFERFKTMMDYVDPEWEIAVIFSKINMFYFTGTMQDGMLILQRKKDPVLWVRRSYERALNESLFQNIMQMKSFRDAAQTMKDIPEKVYIETEILPLAFYQRFHKHFPFKEYKSLDRIIGSLRAVKSEYELNHTRKAGQIHRHVLEDIVPEILNEGMNEADLAAEIFQILIREGHDGVTRFGMFDTEIVLGQLGFGESSIYPNYFNGPGGNYGMSPAVPLIGSRDRKLKKGDLVFVDIGCSVQGYNTDKTETYVFEGTLPVNAVEAHERCVEIQNDIAKMLRPGETPSQIYSTIMDGLDKEFLQNFMGYGDRRVNFLGHGIGLLIDELPVIARGFDEPLIEGMVFALEPKKGIKDVGMVGIENTFVVTPKGGECLTGYSNGLIQIDP